MRKQEIFDTVATHLLEQGEKAVGMNFYGNPKYRNKEGLRCAIGSLFPSDTLNQIAEMYNGMKVKALPKNILSEILPEDENEVAGIKFLQSLQEVHDFNYPQHWVKKLSEFADKYNLSKDCLYESSGIEDMINDLDLEEEKERVLA